jgi:hypothetical protein
MADDEVDLPGPKAMGILRAALEERGLSLRA